MIKHIKPQQSGTLAETLRAHLSLSSQQVQGLLELGAVYAEGERLVCSETEHIKANTWLRVHTNPKRFDSSLLKWPECLIFEDDDYLVIDKPSGLPVHPTLDNTQENILALLKKLSGLEIRMTHRLDVGTSGLLVFAKSEAAQKHFNSLLTSGEVQKVYRALVHGHDVPVGLWTHYMKPSDRAPKNLSLNHIPGWAPCRLEVLDVSAVDNHLSEVTVRLLTGRTHQIRAQMAFQGHPIVGDTMYGSPVSLTSSHGDQFALHCASLMWVDLQGNTVVLKAPTTTWHEPVSACSFSKGFVR